uniref:Uncharacterized protein n=1 Tax=Parascaris univalens TaxID=6257 RepID=A0A915AIJ9_PARUN
MAHHLVHIVKNCNFRSLLLHRQQLSNAMHPQASSFESALSSESSAADSTTVNGIGTASFDSTRSEQTDQEKAPESKLSRQLSESQEEKRSPISLRRECLRYPRSAPYVPLARRIIGKKMARGLQRDYSVDSKTDRIFKEFVKVDPDFEIAPSGRNADHSRLLSECSGFGRHRTVDISDISQRVTIPLICFPE